MNGERPLLTFAVAALNQEQFIREAVEAAFAQTYSPLEIVLSDDGSEDRTFQIMREMAAHYRGPHKIIVNQNPKRRCIGGHINRILEISKGELILAAAGDDISLPHRTQVTYEAWEYSGRKGTSLHSRIIQIDEKGQAMKAVFAGLEVREGERFVIQTVGLTEYLSTLEPLIFGCAHGFARELFAKFDALPEEVIHEDNAIGFRSFMAGQVVFINEPLVKYRVHGSNVYINANSGPSDLQQLRREDERVRRGFVNREIMYRGFLRDLGTARKKGILADGISGACESTARQMLKKVELQRRFVEAGALKKLTILPALLAKRPSREEWKVLGRRALPAQVRLLKKKAGL